MYSEYMYIYIYIYAAIFIGESYSLYIIELIGTFLILAKTQSRKKQN